MKMRRRVFHESIQLGTAPLQFHFRFAAGSGILGDLNQFEW